MKTWSHLGITQDFTSNDSPNRNATTDGIIQIMKEELLWLRKRSSIEEPTSVLTKRIDQHSDNYLRLALSYRAPNHLEDAYNLAKIVLLGISLTNGEHYRILSFLAHFDKPVYSRQHTQFCWPSCSATSSSQFPPA